jgi:hypothetical protein
MRLHDRSLQQNISVAGSPGSGMGFEQWCRFIFRAVTRPAGAACPDNVVETAADGESLYIDFGHLKRQVPLAHVLDQLGLLSPLRDSGPQRRCACPLHRGDARGRTFSENLDDHVFQCFDPKCGQKGDIIDLWSGVRGLGLRTAALDLARTFGVELAPRHRTEKKHG